MNFVCIQNECVECTFLRTVYPEPVPLYARENIYVCIKIDLFSDVLDESGFDEIVSRRGVSKREESHTVATRPEIFGARHGVGNANVKVNI